MERPEEALCIGLALRGLGVGGLGRNLPVGLLTFASEVHSMRQVRNVFETILKYGHDEDFAPVESEEFSATDAPAGSRNKLEVLARRIEQGLPLWHPEDRPDYSGLTGVVRPRE
jgi:hypothetical protein